MGLENCLTRHQKVFTHEQTRWKIIFWSIKPFVVSKQNLSLSMGFYINYFLTRTAKSFISKRLFTADHFWQFFGCYLTSHDPAILKRRNWSACKNVQQPKLRVCILKIIDCPNYTPTFCETHMWMARHPKQSRLSIGQSQCDTNLHYLQMSLREFCPLCSLMLRT